MKELCFLSILLIFTSCRYNEKELPLPQIKQGVSRISGTVVDANGHSKARELVLTLYNPISATNSIFNIKPDDNGNFCCDISLETDYMVGFINDKRDCNNLLISLKESSETKLDIKYDEEGKAQVYLSGDILFSLYDTFNAGTTMNNLILGDFSDLKGGPKLETLYDKSTDYYIEYSMRVLRKRLEIVERDTCLSMRAKQMLKNEFKLFFLNNQMFTYNEMIRLNFMNTNSKEKLGDYKAPSEPSRSFYKFLKDFDLNDPTLLYSSEYSKLIENILVNNSFNIPSIREMSIEEWNKTVSEILADLIGFKSGLFYDVLAANSFDIQLNDEQISFTENQIKNIKSYWKEGEISKILLKKNNEIVELNKDRHATIVNNGFSISKEAILDSIVSKHTGKTIIIDMWATWCSPCIQAIQQFRSIKSEYIRKEVAFVYLTNSSSPHQLWIEKVKGIGGEHYYLSDDQWKYIMGKYKLEAIPSYIIYDRKGKTKNVFTGYPGNQAMKDLLENAIKEYD